MRFDPNFRDDVVNESVWQRAMVDVLLPAPGHYGTLRVAREALPAVPLYGQQLTFSAPVPWTCLYEGDMLWMSDTPQERLMMVMGTTGMRGHILVAGGGLGLYPQFLRRYRPVERITVVERHVDVVALLHTTLETYENIEVIHASFEDFIREPHIPPFDGCYIDIHSTIDPRWVPGINWLRDQCAHLVAGTLRVWGYQWMTRELVAGLEREYIPVLRRGSYYDDPLGRDLYRSLPSSWLHWSPARLRAWLLAYTHRVAWPLEQFHPLTSQAVPG